MKHKGVAKQPILGGEGAADGIVRAFVYMASEVEIACLPTFGELRGKWHSWVVLRDRRDRDKGDLLRHMDIAEVVRSGDDGRYALADGGWWDWVTT